MTSLPVAQHVQACGLARLLLLLLRWRPGCGCGTIHIAEPIAPIERPAETLCECQLCLRKASPPGYTLRGRQPAACMQVMRARFAPTRVCVRHPT